MSVLHSLLQQPSCHDPPQQEPLALVCKRRRSEPPIRQLLNGAPTSSQQLRVSTGEECTVSSPSAAVDGDHAAKHRTLARMLGRPATHVHSGRPTRANQHSGLLLAMLNGDCAKNNKTARTNSGVAPVAATSSSAVSSSNDGEAARQKRVQLTAPKLSRHNDAAYYPNIQCILCGEWVCSRNRYMHIESHLQYRPYSCSTCGYDNRKEIFIQLHVKKMHKAGEASVKYAPDPDLEHRAWQLAEQCVRHTRSILDGKRAGEPAGASVASAPAADGGEPSSALEDACRTLAPYAQSFRPKIYNTQRIEKSHAIEESRQMGVVPDLSEVASRERCCAICQMHVGRQPCLLEEHARSHLSRPSYRCDAEGSCTVAHHSAKFLARHAKEVHKRRRPPADLLLADGRLRAEFARVRARAFPADFSPHCDDLTRKRSVSNVRPASVAALRRSTEEAKSTESVGTKDDVKLPKQDLSLDSLGFDHTQLMILAAALSRAANLHGSLRLVGDGGGTATAEGGRRCAVCAAELNDDYGTLYDHAKGHLPTAAFQCRLCAAPARCRSAVTRHAASAHGRVVKGSPADGADDYCLSNVTPALAQQCNLLMVACFPDVPLQTHLHDPVVGSQ